MAWFYPDSWSTVTGPVTYAQAVETLYDVEAELRALRVPAGVLRHVADLIVRLEREPEQGELLREADAGAWRGTVEVLQGQYGVLGSVPTEPSDAPAQSVIDALEAALRRTAGAATSIFGGAALAVAAFLVVLIFVRRL